MRLRTLALSLALALFAWGCSGGSGGTRPMAPAPSAAVTLLVDWQLDLVDNGFFSYEPTELGQLGLSPDERTVYVGTSEGRLFSARVSSGELLWERDLGEPIDGTPVVADGLLFVGAADGRMHALDAAGGGERWTYPAGGNLDSAAAVGGNDVIFATGFGTIVCLNRETGALRWTAEDEDPILRVTRGLHPPVKGQSSPLVRDNRAFVGYPSGRLSALNMSSGSPVWTADLANEETRHSDVDEPPVLIDDRLYAISFSGGLYALDPATGVILWRADVRGATRPVPYRDTLLTTSVDGRLFVLGRDDGAVRWSLRLDDRAPGRVSLVGNYVVLPTTQGALYVLDAASPYIHTRYRPSAGFASVVVGQRGRVVALDNDGVLHGLRVIYE